jgi:4'-phosphopantetheinyl transferase
VILAPSKNLEIPIKNVATEINVKQMDSWGGKKSSTSAVLSRNRDDLVLSADQVHLWSISLQSSVSDIQRLFLTLNPYESHRASQFRFDRDRNQFIACRGLLRNILSLYLHQEPSQLCLGSNAFGKPELRSPAISENQNLRFNYSHSDGMAVFAFARGRELGVDVELIRPEVARDLIPERFFCKTEVGALRTLPLQVQSYEFFRFWTRKEAYIKARGEGLGISLDSFDVCSDRVSTDDKESDWFLQSFVPASGYLAALATQGQGWRTTFIQSPERALIEREQEGVPCCTNSR